jgi:hypothetical protein
MLVEFNGHKIVVRFWHVPLDMPSNKEGGHSRKVKGTKCVLYNVGTKYEDSKYVGVTWCSKKDKFLKPVGRYCALKRALEVAKENGSWELDDKTVYHLFWEDIGNKIKMPWTSKAYKIVPPTPKTVQE